MRVLAPAKLNLRLEVLAREESGFHQLETLFCALELADELDVETAPAGIDLSVQDAVDLGPPEANLVHRAATAFFAATGLGSGVRIVLRKRIPHGAGLGGGSSDAAATLLALDRLHPGALGQRRRLLELGAALGSDVPFFLCGSPLALAWGRGGRLLPLEPLPALDVLLLVPPHGVATKQAYEALARARAEQGSAAGARVWRAARLGDWEDVARHAHNDFEDVIVPRIPELEPARRILREHGALLALLTGSGSVYYGIFRERQRLEAAEAAVHAALPALRTLRTRTAAPPTPLPFG